MMMQAAVLPVRAADSEARYAYDDMAGSATARQLEMAMQQTGESSSGDASQDENILISFSPAQWARMKDIRTHVWVQYGEAWLDMGESAQYSVDEEGRLISDYDGTWLMIEGRPAAYTLTRQEYDTAGSYTLTGEVPCVVNGRKAALVVVHSDEHPAGEVRGYYYAESDGALQTPAPGDVIQLICRVIEPDGTQHTAALGEPISLEGTLQTGVVHLLTMQKAADTSRFHRLFGSCPSVPLFMEMTAAEETKEADAGSDEAMTVDPEAEGAAETSADETTDAEDESITAIALDALARAEEQIEKTLAEEQQLETSQEPALETVSTGILYQYLLRELNGTTIQSPVRSLRSSTELADAARIIRNTSEQIHGSLLREIAEPENPKEQDANTESSDAAPDAEDTHQSQSVYIDHGTLITPFYTMQIPEEWEGRFGAQAYSLNQSKDEPADQADTGILPGESESMSSYGITFYDRQTYAETGGSSGVLFTLALTDARLARYDTAPSAYLGMIVDQHLREIHYLSAWYPADGGAGTEQYDSMALQIDTALKSIQGFTGDADAEQAKHEGYVFYPNPLESPDYRDGEYHIQVISGDGELYGLLSCYAELSEGDVVALNRGAGIVSEAGMIYKPVPVERSARYLGEDMSGLLADSDVPGYFLMQRRTTSGEEGYTFGYVKRIDGIPYVCSFEDGLPLNDYLACASYSADSETKILVCSQEELAVPGTSGSTGVSPEIFLGEGQDGVQAPGQAQMGMFGEVVVKDGRLESFCQIAR